jgi:hypothetical protein
MKRLRQWMFNGLAAASLLLFIASIPLWARSYGSRDRITYNGRYILYGVLSESGNVSFDVGEWIPKKLLTSAPGFAFMTGNVLPGSHGFFFGWHHQIIPVRSIIGGGNWPGNWSSYNFYMPWWFISIAASIFPLAWIIRHLKRGNHSDDGLCSHCGYDMRATPSRCPECGAIPGTSK